MQLVFILNVMKSDCTGVVKNAPQLKKFLVRSPPIIKLPEKQENVQSLKEHFLIILLCGSRVCGARNLYLRG